MSGFIVMSRDATEHPLLRDGERFRAWFWMVAKACWKPTKFDVHGKVITLERGQFCCSVREMAEAWGWSKSAVDRFIQRLVDEDMVISTRAKTGTGSGTGSGTSRSVITICNYAKYQDVPKESGTAAEPTSGTAAGQQRDIKEQGNQLRDTSEPNGSSVSQQCEPVITAWNAMASASGLARCTKLSPKRKKACLARLHDDGLPAILQAIEHVPRSSFLLGTTGSWSGADIDFLLRPDSVTKILEGKYDDRPKQPGPTGPRSIDGRDGVARALDRQLGLIDPAGTTGRRDVGEGDGYCPPPAPRLIAMR